MDNIKFEGFEVIDCSKFESNDGILSQYYKANLRRLDDGKIVKAFIKAAQPSNHRFRFFVDEHDIDVTEVQAYKVHFPELMQFERDFSGTNELQGLFPSFIEGHFQLQNPRTFCLALEDLSRMDFRTIPNKEGLTLVQLKTAMEALAIFHASSFAQGTLKNINYEPPCNFTSYLKDPEKAFPSFLKDLQEKGHQDLIGKMQKLHKNYGQMFQEVLQDSLDQRFWSHGDLWSGNLMFKGETKVKLIDWQFLCGAHPFLDFCTLAYSSFSPKGGKGEEWLEVLHEVYYQKFATTLHKFGLTSEEQIPFCKSEFRGICQEKGFLATIAFFMFAYDMICNEPNFFQRLVWMCHNAVKYAPTKYFE